ncbi:MAG: hypothetical protein H8E46_02605 [FCB group bacterium]|nr:hypothetical protein [FCB group bacterium]
MEAQQNDSNGLIPAFDRKFFSGSADFTIIGHDQIGGKAQGLAFIRNTLAKAAPPEELKDLEISVPRLAVLCTDVFDSFLKRNNLFEIALSDEPDNIIVREFLKGDFPAEYVGDLMALISEVKIPLAIRSSSLLEDALHQPFAGVYATKMIPNNHSDPSVRFQKLLEAVKFVYASTFFEEAKSYVRGAGIDVGDEKMAVVIQEVVGERHGNRFYPTISGVGRTFNYYPTGNSKPEDGVINLALGLGRMVVDGGLTWTYSPAAPRAVPPFGSVRDQLRMTQVEFFAVNMGETVFDPVKETEFEITCKLSDAEYDGSIKFIASTYNARSDRIYPGIGADGPRVINFAPVLVDRLVPLNDAIKRVLEISREAVGAEVEIEFAVTLDKKNGVPARFGFLQVRPMAASNETVDIDESVFDRDDIIVCSEAVLGNGEIENIADVVFVDPDSFDAKDSRLIAMEIEALNRKLTGDKVNYLLIGFGRWGSSDPWLGIPVNWGQISGARAIVEATLPNMNADLSQGSHFFHNLTAFGVPYFSVSFDRTGSKINWDWFKRQKTVEKNRFSSHVRLNKSLTIRVDGRSGKGVIFYE